MSFLNLTFDFKRKTISFLVLLFFIEYILFKHAAYRDIVNFYPTSFDQSSYLAFFYLIYENIKKYGFFSGLFQTPPLATGILFPLQAVIIFLLMGASRWHALLINFTYFLALQFCFFSIISHYSKRYYLPLIALGLLLSIKSPFLSPGGMFDVRMDFIAACLYGIFVLCIVRTGFFLDRKLTLLSIFIAAFTILMRTITMVYISGACVSLGIFFLTYYSFLKKDKATRIELQKRIINLFIFAFLLCLLTLPFIWFNKQTLYNYYVIGHLTGPEKYIRAAQEGTTNLLSTILFYPQKLFIKHLGIISLSISLIVTGTFLFLQIKSRKPANQKIQKNWVIDFISLFIFILIPMVALTFDINKSPVVANIMVIPTVLLLVWYWVYIESNILFTDFTQRVLKILAISVFAIGVLSQIAMFHHRISKHQEAVFQQVNKMYLELGDFIVSKNWPQTLISFDHLSDFLTSKGISIVYYEKKGKLLDIATEKLGASIFSVTEREAIESLKRSNVFILNLTNDSNEKSSLPFDNSVQQLRPILKNYAESHFARLNDYQIDNSIFRVYVIKNNT